MANGDIGRVHGFEPVSVNADFRSGYDDINRLADWAGSTTEITSADISWQNGCKQWSDAQQPGDTNRTSARRSRAGMVVMQMNIMVGPSIGAGTVLLILPNDFRPKDTANFVASAYDVAQGKGWAAGPCAIEVKPSGTVTYVQGGMPNAWGGIFGCVSFGTLW